MHNCLIIVAVLHSVEHHPYVGKVHSIQWLDNIKGNPRLLTTGPRGHVVSFMLLCHILVLLERGDVIILMQCLLCRLRKRLAAAAHHNMSLINSV